MDSAAGTVEEDAQGLEVVDEQEDIGAGETRALAVNLQPGKYVLICNTPGHYQLGMHTGFSVTGRS